MIAELTEKNEGTFAIKYTAQTAAEALFMSLMCMGKEEVSLNCTTEYVHVGGTTFRILENYRRKM